MSKDVAITKKKVKQYVRQIKCTNKETLPSKVPLDIDFTDKLVVPYDTPTVENTSVGITNKL